MRIAGRARWGRLGMRVGMGVGVGAGATGLGVLGLGWFYSGLLLDTRVQPVLPERVRAADARSVTLAPGRLVRQPGVWGLRWPDGLAVLGDVLADGRGGVVRRLLDGPVPPVGPAVVDAGPYDPDPAARGLVFEEVAVPTPLGPAPAWLVPADGLDTWAVLVHGRGGSRREALRVLPALHGLGLPALTISYRNDPDAPPSPDGHHHLGDTEWEDLAAAVALARERGARRVVLVAWSMGGAVTAAFLDRSPLARHVVAVVWDAPLVDWRATLRQQARNRRLPAALTVVATAATTRRIGIDFDRFDLRRHPPAVRPPTLVVHSDADTAVPVAASRALVAAAPGLGWPMRYLEVAGVEHTGSWNADPAAYEAAVTGFLRRYL